MSNPSHNDIARAIYQASKSHAHDSSFSSKIVRFLARKRLLAKAPDILARLSKIINQEEGRVVGRVSSAQALSASTEKSISDFLIKRYHGKSAHLVPRLDENLVGGFKIEVGDEVIDFTVRNKIKKLQTYLTSAYEYK